MTDVIPQEFMDLFEKKAFAHLATVMPDGSPQVTPVWCDHDGECVRVNSAKGRRKDKNMRREPRVALSLLDPENPYRYLEVRGTVIEITEEGADAHIDFLTQKYIDQPTFPYKGPGEVRVIYRIKPERITSFGD